MCPGKVGQPDAAAMADAAKNQWCFGKESVEAAIAAVGRGELVSCCPPLLRPCAAPDLVASNLDVRRERGSKGLRPVARSRVKGRCLVLLHQLLEDRVKLGHVAPGDAQTDGAVGGALAREWDFSHSFRV